jgi:hypothetical protein
MSLDNTEVYGYREAIIKVVWFWHEEVYHWYVFAKGEKRGDSLKQLGYEQEDVALVHAKRHADWVLDDCEEEE